MTSIKGAPTDGYTSDPNAYVPAAPPAISYKTDADAPATIAPDAAAPAEDSYMTAGAETVAPPPGPPPATGLAVGSGEPPAVSGPNAELLALSPLFDSGDPIPGSNMRRSIGNYRGTQEPNDDQIRSLMHQAFNGSGDPAALKALVSMMPSPADPEYAAKTQHFAAVAGPELTKMEQNGEVSSARSTAIWSKLSDVAAERFDYGDNRSDGTTNAAWNERWHAVTNQFAQYHAVQSTSNMYDWFALAGQNATPGLKARHN